MSLVRFVGLAARLRQCMTRGQCGWLDLQCIELSFTTLCRFDRRTEIYMSHVKTVTTSEAQEATARPHQPSESVFKSILAEDVDWKPFAAFPPSVRLAVIVGQPSEGGVYTIRVKVPHGVK